MDIQVRARAGKWSIRAGGAVLGESSAALELSLDDAEVVLFPRADVAMAMLEPSDTSREAPGMGPVAYFSIPTKSTVLEDAVWSYTAPPAGAERVRDYLAFDGGLVTVEEI